MRFIPRSTKAQNFSLRHLCLEVWRILGMLVMFVLWLFGSLGSRSGGGRGWIVIEGEHTL